MVASLCFLPVQAMVTRYSSISTRKLSNALKILTADKCMVATSDYGEFHKLAKRCILTNVLGASAQVCYYSSLCFLSCDLCVISILLPKLKLGYVLVTFRSDIDPIETP